MRRNYNEALLYGTLYNVLCKSEVEAWKMYSKAKENFDISKPLFEYLDALSELFGIADIIIKDEYIKQKNCFELYNDRISYEILSEEDEAWPKGAEKGENPVHFLFLAGETSLLLKKRVTVIGMKNPTKLGLEASLECLNEIKSSDAILMSVFESGIDLYSIQNALAMNIPQIIVLSSPLNQCNPNSCKELMVQLASSGSLLVTSFSPATKSEKWFSIPRNRLLMAMSQFVVIPEEKDGGPSWALADIARENGVPVTIFNSNLTNELYSYASSYALKEGVVVYKKKNDLKKILKPTKISRRKKVLNPDQLELF